MQIVRLGRLGLTTSGCLTLERMKPQLSSWENGCSSAKLHQRRMEVGRRGWYVDVSAMAIGVGRHTQPRPNGDPEAKRVFLGLNLHVEECRVRLVQMKSGAPLKRSGQRRTVL